MIAFPIKDGGSGSRVRVAAVGLQSIDGPAGRPGGLPYIAMAGNFFHPTHPHPHTDHPIDFINPDCHLLGKKSFESS